MDNKYSRDLLTPQKAEIKAKSTKTFKIPQSSALDRARIFVPLLAEANQELDMKIHSEGVSQFDIENTDSCKDSLIEMNLGIFETEVGSSDDDCLDDSDSEISDCSCDEMNCSCFKPSKYRPLDSLKLPQAGSVTRSKGTNPVIQILSSKQTESASSVQNCMEKANQDSKDIKRKDCIEREENGS